MGWSIAGADGKVLVIGNEDWPFPVPLVKDGNGWRFDTAAGKEEVLARRIGRNELAVDPVCRTYVARSGSTRGSGHDGKPAGLYADVRSDPGRQNGLYWPASHGQKRSPLGDLVAQAAEEGRSAAAAAGPAVAVSRLLLQDPDRTRTGGARRGEGLHRQRELSGGFALVAWPAQYDVTGVMTFIVNHDGILHEKDSRTRHRQVARDDDRLQS